MRRVEKFEPEDFDWDPRKRLINIKSSGLDFLDAALALLDPHLEAPSNRGDEPRTKAICSTSDRIIIVIFTMRGDICRIISSWPADKNEQRQYREVFGG